MDYISWLAERGIDADTAKRYGITGDDTRIEIPIRDVHGKLLFQKIRTIPQKQYLHEKGARATLFGLDQLQGSWCVLTEGELDTVRLSAAGIPAVSGTAGAACFKEAWVSSLPRIVFICYDTDATGKSSAVKVHWKIHGSRIVELPGDIKDVTDYLRTRTVDDFKSLLKKSIVVPPPLPELKTRTYVYRETDEVKMAKEVPIENLMKFTHRKAKCIWHNDSTPSLHLYPDNHVFCFGCQKNGDAVSVYMQLNNKSFKDAVEELSRAR